jgi:hypothetical protein
VGGETIAIFSTRRVYYSSSLLRHYNDYLKWYILELILEKQVWNLVPSNTFLQRKGLSEYFYIFERDPQNFQNSRNHLQMPFARRMKRSKLYTKAPYFYANVSTYLFPGPFCSVHVYWYIDTFFYMWIKNCNIYVEIIMCHCAKFVILGYMAPGICEFVNYRPVFDNKFYCIVSVFLILLWNMLIHYEGHKKEKPVIITHLFHLIVDGGFLLLNVFPPSTVCIYIYMFYGR